ncbi:hypothetical protein [Demequina sp. NBRC 110053]|uniref:LppM family (lipo)protein n=1 Tax=Demequina sp. NBRC 110053 TaxID=1570342 RepID=UPI0011847C16|nr:hypothetical protein [Demequina sp. NBRC 110053]
MKNAMRVAALSVVSAAVLAGCLKVDMSVTLHEDDTASGEFVMAVSKGLADVMGEEELAGALESETIEGATQEPYEDEDFVGTRTTFEDLAIAELADETLTVTREGDEFVVSGTPTDLGAELGEVDIPADATATLAVTFPGEVTEHNGTLDGTTVTWDLITAPDELQARGAAVEGGGIPVWIIVLVLAVMGIGIGIAVVLVTSTRRKAPENEASLTAEREAGFLTHPTPDEGAGAPVAGEGSNDDGAPDLAGQPVPEQQNSVQQDAEQQNSVQQDAEPELPLRADGAAPDAASSTGNGVAAEGDGDGEEHKPS